MFALILAGGQGTRLRPLTELLPKPVLPLLDRPVIHYVLWALRELELERVILASGHGADRLRIEVSLLDLPWSLSIHREREPRGTGGGVAEALEAHPEVGAPLVVMNGDIITTLPVREVVAFHERERADLTIVGFPVRDPSRFGLIEVSSDGFIRGFVEKPSSPGGGPHYINAGIYVFGERALEMLPRQGNFSLERDFFPAAARDLRVKMYPMGLEVRDSGGEVFWADVGTIESFFQVHFDILYWWHLYGMESLGGERDDASLFKDYVYLHRSADPARGARFDFKVVVSARASVGQGAKLTETILMPDAVVEEEAELERVIVAPGTVVRRGEKISDQVLYTKPEG